MTLVLPKSTIFVVDEYILSDLSRAVLIHFSYVWLFAKLWTVTCQAPLSMGISRQEYWSGLPHPPLGDLPDLGIEPTSPRSAALAGRFFTTSANWGALLSDLWWYYLEITQNAQLKSGVCLTQGIASSVLFIPLSSQKWSQEMGHVAFQLRNAFKSVILSVFILYSQASHLEKKK